MEEEEIKKRLEEHMEYIAACINDPVELLMHYTILPADEKKRLNTIRKSHRGSPDKVVFEILHSIINRTEIPDRFSALVQAMEDAENRKVVDILKGQAVPNDVSDKLKIDAATTNIVNYLHLVSLLAHFKVKGIITYRDLQMINSQLLRSGASKAIREFLQLLPNKSTTWYRDFMSVLIENDHEHLAEMIDKDLVAEMKAVAEDRKLQGIPVLSEDTLPTEIQAMDKDKIELYRKALQDGHERVFDIRLKLVGHQGVGKTSLTKRLRMETVDSNERKQTDGIDVHIGHCKISLETGEWVCFDEDCTLDTTNERLWKALSDEGSQAEDGPKNRDLHSEDQHSMEVENDFQGTNNKVNDVSKPLAEHAEETKKKEIGIPEATVHDMKDDNDFAVYFENLGKTTHQQEKKNHAQVSIWDFAGQTVFYNTHQIFLSPRSIFLLVSNIDESLDSDIAIDQNDCMSTKICKVSEFLEFWLNSIHFFCNGSDSANDPPVILVATHADSLGKDKEIAQRKTNEYFKNIRKLFMSKETAVHIVDDADIAVENLRDDPNIEELKKTILKVAKKQNIWGEQRPTKWITLERELFEQKHKGRKVINRNELEDMNRHLPVPLSEPELQLFLRFQNDIGNFLHFNDEELADHVVLDPQWLVDAFKCIVTTGENRTVKKREMLPLWVEFEEKGKLSQKLIEFLLSEDFKESSNIITGFLERLGIIAKPVAGPESGGVVDYFFAPCFLRNPPESVFNSDVSGVTTNRLCLSTVTGFLPEILFNRLLAACVSNYKIVKDKGKDQIFMGCGVFYYDQNHFFTLVYINNLIKVWVTCYDRDSSGPEIGVCKGIRRFMVQNLMRLCKLDDETKIKIYIDCPNVAVKTQNGLHEVSTLQKEKKVNCDELCTSHNIDSEEALKHWFPSKENYQNTKAPKSILPSHLEQQVPTELQLTEVSQRIGKEYKTLAKVLGLTMAQIDHIIEDNKCAMDRIFGVLKAWKKANAKKATFRELEVALTRSKLDAELVLEPIINI